MTACISSTTRTALEARIVLLQTALDAAYDSYIEALNAAQDYRFDSGEGSQRVKRRDPSTVFAQIKVIESEINRSQQRLDGTGIVSVVLRRKPVSGEYYR